MVDRQWYSTEGTFWYEFTVHDRCLCCSAATCSESADYHLIPSGHCFSVPAVSDVWFALLHLCCHVVPFFLLLLLMFPFYPICEVLGRILFDALYSLVEGFLIPTCLGTQSNVIFPLCWTIIFLMVCVFCPKRPSLYSTSPKLSPSVLFFPCAVYSVYDRWLFRVIYWVLWV
jgi:hypothetical protein